MSMSKINPNTSTAAIVDQSIITTAPHKSKFFNQNTYFIMKGY